jgi:hypothetical protein
MAAVMVALPQRGLRMFGLFQVRCPVSLVEKTWIEWRMRWLAGALGIDRLLDAEVLLPTDEHFPGEFQGSRSDAREWLAFLGHHMGVNTGAIDLEVLPDELMPQAAGHYQPDPDGPIIRVAESKLARPQELLATLAHELAHEILLGGRLLSPEVADHEWVTDLLMVYLGVGIFAANATVSEASGYEGNWSWWQIGKQGYLSAHMFGYAMAQFAFMRREEAFWGKHLRPDAADTLVKGLRFLHKTNDTLFHPDTIRAAHRQPTLTQRADALRQGSASVRLATLWEIGQEMLSRSELDEAVQACLGDPEDAIVAEALRVLATTQVEPPGGAEQLIHLLWHGSPVVQAAAVHALGELRLEPVLAVPNLAAFLDKANDTLVQEACRALCAYSVYAGDAVPKILDALRRPYRAANYSVLESLLRALQEAVGDARTVITKRFGSEDPEMCRLLLEMLDELVTAGEE